MEQKLERFSKSKLREIKYTKEWLEGYINNPKSEKIEKYLNTLYNELFVANRSVSGLKTKERKDTVLKVDFIKYYKDKADLNYAKNPTQENKELAISWNDCYKSYIKNVVEKALNKADKPREMV